MKLVKISLLIAAASNRKQGTLREAFPGEEPDFVQERDKLCTGIIMQKNGVGFSADFPMPIQLAGGTGYVFEERTGD